MRSPALDHIIERPRLITRLEEADARLILFVAPAGYGKTTLARQWSARQTGPVAWYRTTRSSGDVAALAVDLDALLATVAPDLPRDPRRVASIASANPKPKPLARALVTTYAPLTRDVLLVLDEYEAAKTDAADILIENLVTELNIRFLLTSRTRPSWFRARLLVYGEALELGLEELSMTDDESMRVLSNGPSSASDALLAKARGWPAILGLAALTDARQDPHPEMLSQTLYDFLANELLDAIPRRVELGLVLLAAATITDSRLARLVLRDDADDVLGEVEARGLISLQSDGTVVLHPLLRELLLARLPALPPASVRQLMSRSRVLLKEQCWNEALAIAEALPTVDFITLGLTEAFDDLLRLGRLDTLERWIDAGKAAGGPSGLLNYAHSELAFRSGEFHLALVLATRAANLLEGDFQSRAHLVAARAAYFVSRAQLCANHITAARQSAVSAHTQASALWVQFTHALAAEDPHAAVLLHEFETVADDSVEHILRVAHGSINLGLVDGDLTRRMVDVEPTLALLGSEVDPMVQSSLLNIYSNALSACGRYLNALRAADREFTIADEYGLAFVKSYALVNRVRALIGLRRLAHTSQALSRLTRAIDADLDPYLHAQHAVQKACLHVTAGDFERARDALFLDVDQSAEASVRGEYLAYRSFVFAASSMDDEAVSCASLAREASRATEVRAFTAVAGAITAIARANTTRAEEAIDEVFETGALDALVLALRASPDLARFVVTLSHHHKQLVEVLVGSNDAALARRAGLTIPRTARRSKSLSPRELEIHELIAQGMTNREIATLLFISESTTKVHVSHILQKLGARSRAEAVHLWLAAETD
jgi:ATP/maltotriose-dependent transcriptional regulator MalT